MRTKILCLCSLLIGCYLHAQDDSKMLSLQDAVQRAWQYSNPSKLSSEKLLEAESQLQALKNNRYPDVTLGGKYLYMTKPDLSLQFQLANASDSNSEPAALPEPHSVLVGQAGINLPIFSGFKIKNAIKAGEHQLEATQYKNEDIKADLAMQTIAAYVNLYKARKTVNLIKQNLQTAHRRVIDFTAMEENGLLPLNDLLKAKLQESTIKLTLAKAQKTARILNYKLAIFLELPNNSKITIDSTTLSSPIASEILIAPSDSITRPDLQALMAQEAAAQDQIKIEKGSYYPTIGLTAGYLAADIENTLSITNAINVGVGVSYNLTNIFKNKSKVHVAQSRAKQLQIQVNEAKDQVSILIKNAQEDYQLALQNFEVYQTSKCQAEENYRIVKDKFDNGLLDTKDLLEADTQRLQSQIDLAVSKVEITAKYYALKQATGSLITLFKKN